MQISRAAYGHQLNRLRVMVRGAMICLIYQRSLHVQNASYEDGSAVTLMSTDVDSVQDVGQMFHEAWAQLLESDHRNELIGNANWVAGKEHIYFSYILGSVSH